MGYRLTTIYTRTGDRGSTGLGDGARVEKDHPRIEAIGDIDELNCTLGLVLAESLPAGVRTPLAAVQHDLFDLGGEVATPGFSAITERDVTRLEQAIESINGDLPPLEEFILPGGGRAAATCHLARAVCRRAERRLVTLAQRESVAEPVLAYLNRLSDLLFVAARSLARTEGDEVLWQRDRPR